MREVFLIYKGTEEFNDSNIQKTRNTLLPENTSEENVIIKEGSLRKNIESIFNEEDFMLFFQEAGVTNTSEYVNSVRDAIRDGAELGCARWEYFDERGNVPLSRSILVEPGCNLASLFGVIHNNGFINNDILEKYLGSVLEDKLFSNLSYKAKGRNFAFINDQSYLIPVSESVKKSPLTQYVKEDIPNAFNTFKNYFKK